MASRHTCNELTRLRLVAALVVILAYNSLTAHALPSCFPIQGASLDEKGPCCALGPFDSICTSQESKNTLVASESSFAMLRGGKGQAVLLNNSTNTEITRVSPSGLSFASILNATNPVGKLVTSVNGKLLTAVWTLKIFESGNYDNVAVYTEMSYALRCIIRQLVGSVGVATRFANAKCVSVCNGRRCSPFAYCSLPYDGDAKKAWFAVTDGRNRMFWLGLLVADGSNKAFLVSLKGDCLGTAGYGYTTGFFQVQVDPATGGYQTIVKLVTWGGSNSFWGTKVIDSWGPNGFLPSAEKPALPRATEPVLVASK